MSNMKKYVIAGVLVVAVVVYIIFARSSSTAVVATTPSGTTNTAPSAPSETTNPTGTTETGSGTPPSNPSTGTTGTGGTPTGQYKDGTYTGPVTNAVYGNIQVAVTISGGKITDVEVPVFPTGPGHTSQVSASAIPALKQEALTAQSANVNVVSGATQDSQAFQQSLAAALAQAQA